MAACYQQHHCRGLRGPWGAACSLPSLPQAQYRTTRGQSCHLTCHHTGGHTPDIKLHEASVNAVSPSPLHFESAFIKHHQSSDTVPHWSPLHFATARATQPCYAVRHEADSCRQRSGPRPSSSEQQITAVLNSSHRGHYNSRPASTSNHRNQSARRQSCLPPFHVGPPNSQRGAHSRLCPPHRVGSENPTSGIRSRNLASYKSSSTPRVRQPGTSNSSAYSRPWLCTHRPFFLTAQPNFGSYGSQQLLCPVPAARSRLLLPPPPGHTWL